MRVKELDLYFPSIFESTKTKEYYDLIKRKTTLTLDDIANGTSENEAEIDSLTDKLLTFTKPQVYSGKNGAEVSYTNLKFQQAYDLVNEATPDLSHTEVVELLETLGVKQYNQFNVPEKLMLVVSEVAEAMEGYRKNLMDDKLPHRSMVEVELADVIIRVFDLAGAMKLDLGGAIEEKLNFNKIRPDHKIENRLKDNGKKF